MRDEDVTCDVLDGGIQPVPTRVRRVQREQLRRGIQRPPVEKETSQTRLSGSAASVDQDDGGGRVGSQNVIAYDAGGVGQDLTDGIVTS